MGQLQWKSFRETEKDNRIAVIARDLVIAVIGKPKPF
jgi:hypothetical protein